LIDESAPTAASILDLFLLAFAFNSPPPSQTADGFDGNMIAHASPERMILCRSQVMEQIAMILHPDSKFALANPIHYQ
jgi:hypothetical protein